MAVLYMYCASQQKRTQPDSYAYICLYTILRKSSHKYKFKFNLTDEEIMTQKKGKDFAPQTNTQRLKNEGSTGRLFLVGLGSKR